jgi:hypothetical protein
MRREEDLETLRWRVRNCEATLTRLIESQARIAQFPASDKKRYLASLNAQSIAAVERSLAVLQGQLEQRRTARQ